MYRIPKDDDVGASIRSTLEEYKEIGSQKLLHSLVLKRLRRENQFYKLSPERVKRIAASMPEVKVFVEKRKSVKEARKCYICGHPLKRIKVKDLFGDPTYAGKKCLKCGFKIDRAMLVPKRYLFYRR
ncbi:MAG: hypothetical protein QF829_03535 [Candidatus Hydrothermarchaeota archaeon]|jgi:hypothetical protein|nr:hypothetical protein [Candidatus Hydrothermarchaeota archaeon]